MMQTYKKFISLFFIFICFNCYSNIESNPSISKDLDLSQIDWENQIPINLSYPWEFYWLELYEPEDFGKGLNSNLINNKESFRPWTQRGKDNINYPARGYATYRMRVKIQDEDKPKTFSIFYNHLFSASKLFINGELVHENGIISKDINQTIEYRSNSLVQITTNEKYLDFILHVANNKFYHGGPRAEFLIASPQQMQVYHTKSLMIEIFIFGIIFGSVVYHLFFFLLNQSQLAFLFFALICFTFLIRIPFLNSKTYELILPVLSFEFQTTLLHFINIASFLAGNLFLNALFQNKKIIIINYIFYIGAFVACLAPLFHDSIRYSFYLIYLIVFLLLFLLHSILLLYLNRENKDKESYYLMGIGLLILGIFCFLTISLNFIGLQGGIYLIIGYLLYVIFQSVSLSKYFTYAIESRANLEFKMAEENQAELAKQRSDMQIMMHDNLGADLTDLKVFLEKQSRNSVSLDISKLLPSVQDRVLSIIKSLRNQLLFIEDLNLTYENFLTGLNLTLLRRYSDAGREFDFSISDELSSSLQSVHLESKNRVYFLDIYYMLYEICTNDLKYGKGESTWRLELLSNTIRIFQTNALSDSSQDNIVLLKSVGNRLQNLNGRINSQIKDNHFIAEIFVPYSH